MKKDETIEAVAEVVDEDVTTEVVEVKKSLLAKPMAFGRKHGKKALTVIVGGGLLVAGYMLGKSAGANSVSTNDGYNYDDTDDCESEDNTEL